MTGGSGRLPASVTPGSGPAPPSLRQRGVRGRGGAPWRSPGRQRRVLRRARGRWRGAGGTSGARRRAGDGGAVPQLRVGPGADRGADGVVAGWLLQLARALARPPRHPGQDRALPSPGLQRRDFRLLHPTREAFHDGFHPQCTHLCPGLAVLHPPRKAVPGLHSHRALLPPAGLLDLQLPLPLHPHLVAGAHRLHGADGCHRRVPLHEDRAARDPAQLCPQIQRIDSLRRPRAASPCCFQHKCI